MPVQGPVHLSDPLDPQSRVVQGCAECARLFKRWRETSTVGPNYDPSRASDFAVLIRRHPHEGK